MEAEAPRTTSIWRGHRVRLRPVEPDDWRRFAAWGRDDLVSRNTQAIPFPRSEESVRRWTEHQAIQVPVDDAFRWLIQGEGDEPVGTINTHSCDRRVGSFSYGIAVAPEAHRRGYGSEAIRLVLRYYFGELGYQKVHVHIYDFNEGSRRLHERLGFRLEGRLRRMTYSAGRHWDVLVFGLLREEFEAEQAAKLPPFLAPTFTSAVGADTDQR